MDDRLPEMELSQHPGADQTFQRKFIHEPEYLGSK